MDELLEFEGPVEKTTGVLRNKSKIWLVLEKQCIIFYKDSKRQSCIGSIEVPDIHLIRQTGHKGGQEFQVNTTHKSYTFVAPSKDQAEKWVKVVQHAMSICHSSSTDEVFTDSSSMSDTATPSKHTSQSHVFNELSEISSQTNATRFGVKLKSVWQQRSLSQTSPNSKTTFPSQNNNSSNEQCESTPEKKFGPRTQSSPDCMPSAKETSEKISPTIKPPPTPNCHVAETNGTESENVTTCKIEATKSPIGSRNDRPRPTFKPPPPPVSAPPLDKTNEMIPDKHVAEVGGEYTSVDKRKPTSTSLAACSSQSEVAEAREDKVPDIYENNTSATNATVNHTSVLKSSEINPDHHEPSKVSDSRCQASEVEYEISSDRNADNKVDVSAVEMRKLSKNEPSAAEEIDMSQVVMRKSSRSRSRGSYQTENRENDYQLCDTSVDTSEVQMRKSGRSSAQSVRDLKSKMDKAASLLRESAKSSSVKEVDRSDDVADSVFEGQEQTVSDDCIDAPKYEPKCIRLESDTWQEDTLFNEDAFNAIFAVEEDNKTFPARLRNGDKDGFVQLSLDAFNKLKQYLDAKYEGFDIDSHCVSDHHSVETLRNYFRD